MKNNKIAILGVCSSFGASLLGTEKAPNIIRKQRIISKLEKMGFDCLDYGNIESTKMHKTENIKLRNVDCVQDIEEQTYYKTKKIIEDNRMPIVLGGDHSINTGSIMAVSEKYENLGIIWIDAHADFNDQTISNSGNMHGMPLSAVCGLGPNEMIDFSTKKSFIKCENIVLIGGRDYEPLEYKKLRQNKVKFYEMSDIKKIGIKKVIDEAIFYLSGCWTSFVTLTTTAV